MPLSAAAKASPRPVVMTVGAGTAPFPAVEIRPGIAVTAQDRGRLGPQTPETRLDDPFLGEVDDLLGRLECIPSGRFLVDFFGAAAPLPDANGFDGSSFAARYGPDDPARINVLVLSRGSRAGADTRTRTDRADLAHRGLGACAYIEFNPRYAVLQDRVLLAPEIVLGHEMIHAAHYVAGSVETGEAAGPYLAGELNDRFAFDNSPLEEIVTHGNPIALEWLFGAVDDPSTGRRALGRTPGQSRSLDAADQYLSGRLDPVEAARAGRIRAQRQALCDISERRLALELGFAVRPSYGPLASEDQAAGIWKKGLSRSPDDKVFRTPIPDIASRQKAEGFVTRSFFDRFASTPPGGFLAHRATARPHVGRELEAEQAARARSIVRRYAATGEATAWSG
ncbi:hypothetical protein ABT071_22035 [Streptomyces sp. NPDC002506]|uniref:M91 family zinc metallopeptidase n=1 Tax=Streptomyces sp. NPDC002506 TaxID=3154536 RepID=UPI0033314363